MSNPCLSHLAFADLAIDYFGLTADTQFPNLLTYCRLQISAGSVKAQ
jgi:hypothetical protein